MTRFRPITGFVAAAAIALAAVTASVTPVSAKDNRDELFRLLLAAAAVAIIVKAYNDRDKKPDYVYRNRVLPSYCLEVVRVRNRDVDVYNAQCLRNAGVTGLPDECRQSLRTNRGRRDVYRTYCLADAGYRAQVEQQARLPRECALRYSLRNDRIRGFDGDCLNRAGFRNLPSQCRLLARKPSGGRQVIYDGDCLSRYGFGSRR